MVSSAASEEVEALSAASGNACRHGKVGLLRNFAPKCFVACEASCPAVGLAIDAYFKHGQGAAEDSVCQNKAAWRCFVEPSHIGACTPLITKAAAFRYNMPKSVGELDALCSRAHSIAAQELSTLSQLMASPAASEEVEALSAASGNACRHGK